MASNLRVDTILPSTGTSLGIGTANGSITVNGSVNSLNVSGNLGVGGVLTYEDVTNVDSVGVITARDGLRVTGIATATEYEVVNTGNTPIFRFRGASNNEIGKIDADAISGTTSQLRLYTESGGNLGERLRIGPAGQIGIGGANYGTLGQVLTSQGSGSAVQWATPGNLIVTRSVNADISGGSSYDFTLPANCYKVDFVGHNIRMSASGTPAFQVGTTAGMITSGGRYNYTEVSYGGSNAGRYQSGDNEIRFGYYNLNASSDTGDIFASFESSSAANMWLVNIDSHRRTQTGYLKTLCALDLSGNNLTTIRLYGWSGVNFATGRYSFTAYSTS